MKNIATLFAGLIIGLIAGIFLYPVFNGGEKTQDTEDTERKEVTEQSVKSDPDGAIQDKLVDKAQPISKEDAYSFFD